MRRQEVLNVILAQMLQERGIISAPEEILKAPFTERRNMPDVIVSFYGLRLAIEGEVEDQPDAHIKAEGSARQRVEDGITHIGVAVVYPAKLRNIEFSELKNEMEKCVFDVAVVSESGESDYSKGDIEYIGLTLKSVFGQLVKEDVVAEAVAKLNSGIERFSSRMIYSIGDLGRTALAIGMSIEPNTPETIQAWSSDQKRSVAMIGGLVIANAMIFQEMLSSATQEVQSVKKTIGSMEKDKSLLTAFCGHWRYIVEDINYYPIFHIAAEILEGLSSFGDYGKALAALAETSMDIVEKRAALRHDLMGRIYHRLLVEAKYLGTYYTSIPAASLLLKAALEPNKWNLEWHDIEKMAGFRIADLACGTGTLLMAAADSLVDNFINSSARAGIPVNADSKAEFHKRLIEEIIHGYDVLPSAIHLTASTLALREPNVSFDKTNLFSLPLGGREKYLGSIEFAGSENILSIQDMFGASSKIQQVKGKGSTSITPRLPKLDLCVMNPPFTRSVGGNLLFGSLPQAEREGMQDRLKKIVKQNNLNANITAGLGSVFVGMADAYLKTWGRMALVLPEALLSGVAWGRTRELFSSKYHVEFVAVSHEPDHWNFSESTDLSEVLVVAKKDNGKSLNSENGRQVAAVNLWKNPENDFEANAVSYSLRHAVMPSIEDGQGAFEIYVGSRKFGEAVSFPWEYIRQKPHWMLPWAFAQSDLIRTAYFLEQGRLVLPGQKIDLEIPLCKLEETGDLGPDRRDIHDGFSLSKKRTIYPAFWCHKSKSVTTMKQNPNHFLSPLPTPKEGRHLRKVADLWPLSGRVLIAERIRLNTVQAVTILIDKPVLSNVWWPFTLKEEKQDKTAEKKLKAFTLWMNSTLGLILLLAAREETEGAWIGFKKPNLKSLPILDFNSLTGRQLNMLSNAYDKISGESLLTLQEIEIDRTRAMIDEAIAKALKLPDISVLRELLAMEPIICLRSI